MRATEEGKVTKIERKIAKRIITSEHRKYIQERIQSTNVLGLLRRMFSFHIRKM